MGGGNSVKTAGIEGIGEALGRTDAHVMVAIGADIQIGHQVAMEDHLAAGRAFPPEIFRRIAAALALAGHQALDPGTDDIGDPVHAGPYHWRAAWVEPASCVASSSTSK